jgi:hypothetical protein
MKTVIEMARKSGYGDHMSVLHAPALERFAELVRADEREACAKVCDDLWEDDGTAYDCAEAIRTLAQT